MAGPRLESRKKTDLAYIEHKGPYDKVPWDQYMKRLYGWAKGQKVMPGFYPMAICLDDPQRTPPEECRSEIAITYKGKAKAQDGVKTRGLSAMRVATISHKGPGTAFMKTYAQLAEWIATKGYVVSGPSIEIYSKKPEVIGDVTILYAKVMMPVAKSP
jgi:DNA gyrase inhibitor GyrI